MQPGRRFFLVIGASLVWALIVASAFYRFAGAGARVGIHYHTSSGSAAETLAAVERTDSPVPASV